MGERPLVTEEIDAGAEFVRKFDEYLPVKAALWMKPDDSSSWYLYILSDQLHDGDIAPAYAEVVRLGRELDNPYASPFRIKLVRATDPLFAAVQDLRQIYPDRFPIWYDGTYLGGRVIDGAYVYPVTNGVPSK